MVRGGKGGGGGRMLRVRHQQNWTPFWAELRPGNVEKQTKTLQSALQMFLSQVTYYVLASIFQLRNSEPKL